MKLRRIRIVRLPGIDQPFTLEALDERINVIVGPNGIGKSSICRAVRRTLWPDRKMGASEVETLWILEDEEETLEARHQDGRTEWRHAAERIPEPRLPPVQRAECHLLRVGDLLQADNAGDQELAARLRTIMAGGHDFESLREAFKLPRSLGRAEMERWQEAQRKVQALEMEFQVLARQEEDLSRLRSDLRRARRAAADLEALRKALRLAGLRREKAATQTLLQQMPPALQRVDGKEREGLETLDGFIAETRRRISEAESRREEALAALREAGLGDDPPNAREVEERTAQVEDLDSMEKEATRLREEEARDEARLQEALRRLGEVGEDPEAFPALRREHLERIEDLLAQRADLDRKLRFHSERVSDLRLAVPEEQTVHTLERGADVLRRWLAAEAATRLPGVAAPPWALPLGSAFLILGAALAFLVHPALALLAGIGLVLLVLPRFQGPGAAGHESAMETLPALFPEALEPPETPWEREGVAERLAEVETARSQARLLIEEGQRLDRIRESLAALEDRIHTLEEETGLLLRDAGFLVTEVAKRLVEAREAHEALARSRAAVRERERACEDLRADVERFLGLEAANPPRSAGRLRVRLGDLKQRLLLARQAEEKRVLAERTLEKERRAAEKLIRDRDALFEKLDLPPGDEQALDALLREFPRFRELSRKARDLELDVQTLEVDLAERREFLELDEEAAAQRLEQAQAEAGGMETLQGRVAAIEARIESERGGRRMEEAQAELEEAAQALRSRWEDARERVAGEFLLNDIEGEYERESSPLVLEAARRLFMAFTRGRYRLMLRGGQNQHFLARDLEAERDLPLDELSDGTRIQLLLAARLAFALHDEEGGPLPLFLDEALSTADPERFEAVMTSLFEIADQECQVFYLTSNPADVAAIARLAESHARETPGVIDLGALRGREAAVRNAEELRRPERPPIPEPGSMSPEAYGVLLGVPPVDLRRPAGGIHLFHLLREDLPLLRHLLERHVTTLAQWEGLREEGITERFCPDPEKRRRLDESVDLARRVHELFQIGRGRPVDREILVRSGAVSETYVNRLAELAEEVDGDARAFLERFGSGDERSKGFRTDKLRTLRTFLLEEGCLDERTPLMPGDIIRRLIIEGSGDRGPGVLSESEVEDLVCALVPAALVVDDPGNPKDR